MARKKPGGASVATDGSPPVKPRAKKSAALSRTPSRPSTFVDARFISCDDNLEYLLKLPNARSDFIYIVPRLNSNLIFEQQIARNLTYVERE